MAKIILTNLKPLNQLKIEDRLIEDFRFQISDLRNFSNFI